ncbi:MAG: endonuclease/exonuclease/phosphatase family protein [Microcoleus sp. SIO2G3]|nr:endonuclease/exonuclease/phosphatase family protein [Microcoleus sp. SIO2G3]
MDIKVMSFNLRYDKPDPGENAWAVRKHAVAAMITHYAPDIIGTQEGQAHQLLDLHRLLPNYQSVGGDRLGTRGGEHCAIFYHTKRLQCLAVGDFFLSDTPEIPGSISPDWGNSLPRMVTWAVFTVVDKQQAVTVFNTHLDYESTKAQELSAKLISDRACALLQADRLSQLQLSESYVFLTGDFNSEPDTPSRKAFERPLSNGVNLNDVLAGVELEHQQSFHDFTGKGFAALDTIYYDRRTTLQSVELDKGQWKGVWPSDHFPVIANFAFPVEPKTPDT